MCAPSPSLPKLTRRFRTLLELKRTLLTALPMLKSDAPGSTGLPGLSAEDVEGMDLPPTSNGTGERTPLDDVQGTADIVLWRARRHAETMDRFEAVQEEGGEQAEVAGWVCLEGDPAGFVERGGEERGERKEVLSVQIRDMKMPVWERWVDVYVR